MSTRIPDNMLLSDLLKATGYDCPQRLQGKTFEESTTGEGNISIEANKEVTISENGTTVINPSEGKDAMEKVTVTVNVPESSGGSSGGGGGGALRYFDGRNTGYPSNPKGFWVIGKNQTTGNAHCLVVTDELHSVSEPYVMPIKSVNSNKLNIDPYGRETYSEVTEDVVAAALGAN